MPIIVESYGNDIFCEIGEFGKDSSKVWQKFKWDNLRGLLAAGNFHENDKNPSKVLQNLKWGDKEKNLNKRWL